MGKTSRDSGWKRTNTELIRIFFQTVPQNHKNWPRLLKNLFITKYLHKGSKLYLTWNSSKWAFLKWMFLLQEKGNDLIECFQTNIN